MQIARGPRNRANTRESDESVTEGERSFRIVWSRCSVFARRTPLPLPLPTRYLTIEGSITSNGRYDRTNGHTDGCLVDPVPVRVEHDERVCWQILSLATSVLINRTTDERQNRHNYTLEINRRVAQGHSPFPFSEHTGQTWVYWKKSSGLFKLLISEIIDVVIYFRIEVKLIHFQLNDLFVVSWNKLFTICQNLCLLFE